jgi:hypothetical protein
VRGQSPVGQLLAKLEPHEGAGRVPGHAGVVAVGQRADYGFVIVGQGRVQVEIVIVGALFKSPRDDLVSELSRIVIT